MGLCRSPSTFIFVSILSSKYYQLIYTHTPLVDVKVSQMTTQTTKDFDDLREKVDAELAKKVKPKCDRTHECEFGAECVAPSIAKCPYGYGEASE